MIIDTRAREYGWACLQAQVAYINNVSHGAKYDILEVEYRGELRFVISEYSWLDGTRYYLIDKDFVSIKHELPTYLELYACYRCGDWVNIAITHNTYVEGADLDLVRVCSRCYELLDSEYRNSMCYRRWVVNQEQLLADLRRKYADKKDWQIRMANIDGERRIIREVATEFRGAIEYSYYLLDVDDMKSQMLVKCSNCGILVRAMDYRKTKEGLNVCLQCRDKEVGGQRGSKLPDRKMREIMDSLLVPDRIAVGDITYETKTLVRSRVVAELGDQCYFTGDSDYEMDHFIALSTGHVGIVEGNYIPLSSTLNASKGAKNPFEWVNEDPVGKIIGADKWAALIAYNAAKLELSVEEYRAFVFWCYENPRDIRQLFVDHAQDEIDSIRLWKTTTLGIRGSNLPPRCDMRVKTLRSFD